MSQTDAEAAVHPDTAENRLARLAASPAATPTEAELLRLLADVFGSLRSLSRELDQLRAELEPFREIMRQRQQPGPR